MNDKRKIIFYVMNDRVTAAKLTVNGAQHLSCDIRYHPEIDGRNDVTICTSASTSMDYSRAAKGHWAMLHKSEHIKKVEVLADIQDKDWKSYGISYTQFYSPDISTLKFQ